MQANGIHDKIKLCAEQLGKWGAEFSGSFKKRIAQYKNRMKHYKSGKDGDSIQKYKENKEGLMETLAQQEAFWKQRAKQFWLNAGDKNSKYFHAVASERKRQNTIQRLKNDRGDWVTWDAGLQEVMVNYFRDMFTTTNIEDEEVLEGIPLTVSDVQNQELLKPIEEEQVKKALFQMHPDKSPGPDGMSPTFYQKYWKIVGKDVVEYVRNFFDSCEVMEGMNDTNLVLISKNSNPSQMGELRPISLCNVLYKIGSKVLANRMKSVLNSVISENQSAFIPGRLISDNIMISFEAMHYLKRKMTGKTGSMALKLDLSKAYDRVEWKFLGDVLTKMGFSERWMHLMIKCVSTVRYEIVNSGRKMGPITPTRGIRQGDPLSPYLFLVCAEGFSALINKYVKSGWISGCRVARGAPVISHMLFADDSYVYGKSSLEEANKISQLLHSFGAKD